jgi:hypothetical protein
MANIHLPTTETFAKRIRQLGENKNSIFTLITNLYMNDSRMTSGIKKESLWANINAKKKAGKKSSHGNSNAHKDAVKAGNTLKQEGSEQVLNVGDRVSFKADPKAIWKILGIQGTTYRINQQGERSISYQPQSWLHNMIGTGKATVLAGNKLKETEHQGSNYKWPMSKATKDRKEADVAAQKAKRKAGNKLK